MLRRVLALLVCIFCHRGTSACGKKLSRRRVSAVAVHVCRQDVPKTTPMRILGVGIDRCSGLWVRRGEGRVGCTKPTYVRDTERETSKDMRPPGSTTLGCPRHRADKRNPGAWCTGGATARNPGCQGPGGPRGPRGGLGDALGTPGIDSGAPEKIDFF